MTKNALVTGASSGIGYATACALATSGINVLGIARRATKLNKLKESHPNIETINADLTLSESFHTIKTYYQTKDSIDYIIISAGQAGDFSPLLNTDPDTLKHSLLLDVLSPLLLLQHLSDKLKDTKVLFIGSYSASDPRHNWGTYSIGKAAQEMLIKCLQKETNENIQIDIFYPGAVDTAIYNSAVSQSKTDFPDQPIYQSFLDNNTVKSSESVATEICNKLLTSNTP